MIHKNSIKQATAHKDRILKDLRSLWRKKTIFAISLDDETALQPVFNNNPYGTTLFENEVISFLLLTLNSAAVSKTTCLPRMGG